jgi:hypothetical protein
MQSAETVLGVLRERGRRGLPCSELYRQMFNPSLYLLAYGKIYANQGAMTPGPAQRPRTACPRTRSTRSPRRCAPSATASVPPGGSTGDVQCAGVTKTALYLNDAMAKTARKYLFHHPADGPFAGLELPEPRIRELASPEAAIGLADLPEPVPQHWLAEEEPAG